MRRLVTALAAASLSGCAVPAIDPYLPTVANAQLVRSAKLPPLGVGRFELAPGLPPGLDRSVTIRTSPLRPPNGESFSSYLGECLAAELRAAGRLDPASGATVSGRLTETEVSSGLPVGQASLAATFQVTRGGAVIYEKNLRVSASWTSSALGAVAIPEAITQYTALYGKLVGALMADEAFRTAVSTS